MKKLQILILEKNGVEEVIVDVVVDNGDRNVLYSGFFSQYTICKTTNKLESIFLTSVKRYSNTNNTFQPINSSIFHIPAEKIYNLNLRYIEKSTTKKQRRSYKIVITFFIIFLLLNTTIPWIYFKNPVHINLIGILIGVINVVFSTSFIYNVLFWNNNNTSKKIKLISSSLSLLIILILSFIQLIIFNVL